MFRKQFEKEIAFESDKMCHSKDFHKDYKLSCCHVSRKCIFFMSWVFEHLKKRILHEHHDVKKRTEGWILGLVGELPPPPPMQASNSHFRLIKNLPILEVKMLWWPSSFKHTYILVGWALVLNTSLCVWFEACEVLSSRTGPKWWTYTEYNT
jgi:hypothetical protein